LVKTSDQEVAFGAVLGEQQRFLIGRASLGNAI
jgi:hypothetical protein